MAGSETGLQLFARLSPRPSLLGLDPSLFPDGPLPQEAVEVAGEPSTGKTLLLSHLIARCVLPKGRGGAEARVVLLDADHHFRIEAVAGMVRAGLASSPTPEAALRECLDRLVIYPLRDGLQLRVTLHAVQAAASSQPDLALVLLDSVSASYWQDSLAGGIRKINLYAKDVLKTLQRTLRDFKGVIMYTRPAYFRSEGSVEACGEGPALVSRRVTLSRLAPGRFSADVETATGARYRRLFAVDDRGIHWQSSDATSSS